MATIALLKTAEDRHTPDSYSIASIPLNKLVPWDGNVRRTNAKEGLDELVASIAAHGVLQSLVVRKANRGKYSIVAGRRRFLALSALAEAGTIAIDAPVPCRIIPGSTNATEISLTENVMRAPMHPADQFEAFRTLIDSGSTAEDVAARFGITEAAVKKRLKLARVSPAIFEAYRKGDLDLEQVQAFAITDDTDAQDRVFAELAQRGGSPQNIRRALTQGEIPLGDKYATFVGIEAYEAAGGAVRRDLFAEYEDGVFLLDAQLLDRLVQEKLAAEIEEVRAEGWKWVEAFAVFDYDARSAYESRDPELLPLSEEAEAEHKRLSEEHQALSDEMQEDDEEAYERFHEIEERIEELEDGARAFTAETLAIAGAVLTVPRRGELDVIRGLVKAEDAPEAEDEVGTQPKEKPPYSALLVQKLTDHQSAAISATLMGHPQIALAAVAFALIADVFLVSGSDGCVMISARRYVSTEDSKGRDALEAVTETWRERLPKTAEDLWAWCLIQPQDVLLDLLAFCAARSLDAVSLKYGDESFSLRQANSIAKAIGLDMGAWFTPDAANYFSRVSRPQIIAAITEATKRPAKRSWDKLKKSELAAFAARETAGTGWLPEPIRA
jgi:ParB family chromosome partitioning protein